LFDPSRVVADKYVLRRELGRGASCAVSEAIHRYTGRVVAIKRLLPEMRVHEEIRARLLREAEALGAIRHPNVVDVLDAGEESDGTPYLVLERLRGRTLEGILAARSRLDLREAMNIAWHTCAALTAAHAVAVVHRDVKPENLIICGDDIANARVKLIDFGIATAPRGSDPTKLTRLGSIVGTPEYIPPELLGKTNVPLPASDVYAVGVTLYECLAGRVPIPGNIEQIKEKLKASPAPPVEAFRKDIPRSLSALLSRALAKDPERRFTTAQAMGDALQAVAQELTSGAPSSRATQQLPRVSQPQVERNSQVQIEPVVQRRKTRRAPYRTPVRLEFDTGAVDARSEDLSRGGMFALVIPSGRPPGIGARASIRFALPSTGEIATVHGVVRWIKPRDNGATACGMEFTALEQRVKDALDQFVEILGQDVED
jgi:serine/threonine-protein kinase